MSTVIPEIPKTATEAYLKELTEKIHKRLEEADNEKTKELLYAVLKAVDERKQQLQQPTEASATLTFQGSPEASYELLEKFELFDSEQQDVEPSQAPLETSAPTDEGDTSVKDPMTEMIMEIQEQQDKSSHNLEIGKETVFELGPDLELVEDVELTIELGPEHEIEPGTKEQETEALQEGQSEQHEQTDPDLFTFENVCQRVGSGESLALFEKITLSEREQQMIEAFNDHLTQMKGLKRQQAFDMQHLTARSIRELEQIFKTYRLQGYLRAELHNVYNRLLNLRSRFSILLH